MNKRNLMISLVFSAALMGLLVWLTPYSMYTGWVFLGAQMVLNLGSCALFGAMLYRILCRRSLREEFGTWLWFLGILALGHGLFSVMFYSAWVCLGLSAAALIKLLADYLTARFGNPEER